MATYENLNAGTRPDPKEMFNAMQKATAKIPDIVGKKIKVTYISATEITLPDLNTGEPFQAPKICLFDDTGKVFVGVSATLYNALRDFINFMGEDFPPTDMKISKEDNKGKQFYTLQIL